MKAGILVLAVAASLIAVGCGSALNSTYTGTETVSQGGGMYSGGMTGMPGGTPGSMYGANGQPQTVTIQLNGENGSIVTGTWTGFGGTYNLQATSNGERLSAITLTPTGAAANPYGTNYQNQIPGQPYYGQGGQQPYYPQQPGQPGVPPYTGTNPAIPGQPGVGSLYNGMNGMCGGTYQGELVITNGQISGMITSAQCSRSVTATDSN